MVICDSSPGIAREARGAGVRPPAACFAEVRDCAEFMFDTHDARLTLAEFVTRGKGDEVQKKYRSEYLAFGWVSASFVSRRPILTRCAQGREMVP